MANKKLIFSVSDNEIFDAYMSAPSHFTEKVLLEEGRLRSILYSKHDDAASLAKKLSRQVYGFKELEPIQEYFSQAGRSDKTSAIQIDGELNQNELKAIVDEVSEIPGTTDEITSFLDGADLVVNAMYTQTDFSRNRFRQRQRKDARINFEIGPDKTTITYPATGKAREIVGALQDRLEERRKTKLPTQEVDLSGVLDPTLRTTFFIKLVSELPNSTLSDVVRVRLESSSAITKENEDDGEELDDEAEESQLDVGVTKTEQVVAGVLRGAALNGQDLFGTSVFQELRQRGFYIASIAWRSRLLEAGNPIVEFSAEFEDVYSCKGFKYAANTWRIRGATGSYNESYSSIPSTKKSELLKRLQRFAMQAMDFVKAGKDGSANAADTGDAGC